MSKRYTIDYSDPDHPTIVLVPDHATKVEARNFTDCHKELLEYCRERRDHWMKVLHEAIRTKASHVQSEEEP